MEYTSQAGRDMLDEQGKVEWDLQKENEKLKSDIEDLEEQNQELLNCIDDMKESALEIISRYKSI